MIPFRPLRIANIALGALLALLAYSTMQSYRQQGPRGKIISKKAKKEATAQEKREITVSQYAVIEHANIFKNRDVVRRHPTPVPTTPPPLPPLRLELKGTTTSPRDGHVKAIIHNKKTRKTDFYARNDVIPDTGGARVKEIKRDRVVLERQGREEILELYPKELSGFKSGTEKRGSRQKETRGGATATRGGLETKSRTTGRSGRGSRRRFPYRKSRRPTSSESKTATGEIGVYDY